MRHSIPFAAAQALCLFLPAALLGGALASEAQECLPAPSGLVSWWPGDGTPEDVVRGLDAALWGGVSFGSGMVGQAFSFNGTDGYAVIPKDAALTLDANEQLSIEVWVWAPTAVDGFTSLLSNWKGWQGSCGGAAVGYILRILDDEVSVPLRDNTASPPEDAWCNLATGNWLPDRWNHLVLQFSTTAPDSFCQLYVNGAEESFQAIPSPGDYTHGQDVYVATHFNACTGLEHFFEGLIDELSLYSRALSASEIEQLFLAGSAGKCKDEDGDGFRPPDDCDETDPSINPAAMELPGNFVDENCDGSLGDCDPCFSWRNHGEYVRCVAHAVEDLISGGILSEVEGDGLVSSAARSAIGRRGSAPPECR